MATDADKGPKHLAKEAGLMIAATGLNFLLPGSGPVSARLGNHILDRLVHRRFARLEDFHRRVFEGDVGEHEINERFRAMEDGDFQHLLAAMLSDIEAEKLPIYTAAYIHLVDGKITDSGEKRWWVTAVTQLQLWDFVELTYLAGNERPHGRYSPAVEEHVAQRLRLMGAVEQETKLTGDVPEFRELEVVITVSTAGADLLKVLSSAIEEAKAIHLR